MTLPEKIVEALENMVTLKITTSVVTGAGADDKKSMVSLIDLLQGDINTEIPVEFVDGGAYASLRAFHLDREKQGDAIIKGNVEALMSLLGLAHAVGETPA